MRQGRFRFSVTRNFGRNSGLRQTSAAATQLLVEVAVLLQQSLADSLDPSLDKAAQRAPIDKRPHEEAAALLASSQAHAIACSNGHSLSGPIFPYGLAYDARLTRTGRSGRDGIGGLLRECAPRLPTQISDWPNPTSGLFY